jgi:hypothetical protein
MNVQHDSFFIENEEHLSPSLSITLAMIKKMQRLKEINNMSDAFLILRIICSCIIGIDLRWAKTKGGFDFKNEVYDHTMALIPNVEVKNY